MHVILFLSGSLDLLNKYSLITYFVSGTVGVLWGHNGRELDRGLFLQFLYFDGGYRNINPDITQLHLKYHYHAKNSMLNQDNNKRNWIFTICQLILVKEHIFINIRSCEDLGIHVTSLRIFL